MAAALCLPPLGARALTLTVDEDDGPSTLPPEGPEGVARGPDGRYYVPGDDCGSGFFQATCRLFAYEYQGTGDDLTLAYVGDFELPGVQDPRGIDFDPNGSNRFFVTTLGGSGTGSGNRGIVEYELPGSITPGGTTGATRPSGGVLLNLGPYTVPPSAGESAANNRDQLEALSAFRNPAGDLFFLLGEEGEGDVTPEPPGGVFLVSPSSSTAYDIEELFRVSGGTPVTFFDDVAGFDITRLAFDGNGALDRANTTLFLVDDSSGAGNSTIFVYNLLGDCLETLGGTDCANPGTLAALFGDGYDDPEGVDFTDGLLTVWFEDGSLVRASVTSDVPESAGALLLAVALLAFAQIRRTGSA
jgi:hypothetical protein